MKFFNFQKELLSHEFLDKILENAERPANVIDALIKVRVIQNKSDA
jgi:hypothetical protein